MFDKALKVHIERFGSSPKPPRGKLFPGWQKTISTSLDEMQGYSHQELGVTVFEEVEEVGLGASESS